MTPYRMLGSVAREQRQQEPNALLLLWFVMIALTIIKTC
jgi:hypothetical protein